MDKALLVVAAIAIVCLVVFGTMELDKVKKENRDLVEQLARSNERIVDLERQRTNLAWGAGIILVLNNAAWFWAYRRRTA